MVVNFYHQNKKAITLNDCCLVDLSDRRLLIIVLHDKVPPVQERPSSSKTTARSALSIREQQGGDGVVSQHWASAHTHTHTHAHAVDKRLLSLLHYTKDSQFAKSSGQQPCRATFSTVLSQTCLALRALGTDVQDDTLLLIYAFIHLGSSLLSSLPSLSLSVTLFLPQL